MGPSEAIQSPCLGLVCRSQGKSPLGLLGWDVGAPHHRGRLTQDGTMKASPRQRSGPSSEDSASAP